MARIYTTFTATFSAFLAGNQAGALHVTWEEPDGVAQSINRVEITWIPDAPAQSGYSSLSSALDAAAARSTAYTIFVAEGAYYPGSAGSRSATFDIPAGTKL